MANGRQSGIGVVLGVVAALLAIGIAVFVTLIVSSSNSEERAEPAVTVTESVVVQPSTTTSIHAPPPSQVQPSGSLVVQGGQFWESEARSFGTSASGQSLVCIYGGAGGYRWVQHAPNSGEVHNIGDPCNHPDDQVAVDPEGKVIMCGGPNSTWSAGP
ncbi:hypothetical protein [Gordonia iterans]